MKLLKYMFAIALAVVIAGCAQDSRFKTYDGPEVTKIQVFKESRRMYLFHHDQVLRVFDVDLGREPEGHKQIFGDGRTPEGYYYIDRRNPNSSFHLSLGINYPRPQDVEVARGLGKDPGGNIFIHGQPNGLEVLTRDWTEGCIAVTNEEMEDIYAMVRDGTPIAIYP